MTHPSRATLFIAGWPVLLIAGCVVDLTPAVLQAPGDGGTDVEIDMSGCEVSCPSGWTKACWGTTAWCTSPPQGTGNCCDAWSACAAQGAHAGFWPDVQGHDGLFPQGFDEYIPVLPAVVVGWSGYYSTDTSVNFACIREGGIRSRGWIEIVEDIATCYGEECAAWGDYPDFDGLCTGTSAEECCANLQVGCGCTMPFWCVIYSP